MKEIKLPPEEQVRQVMATMALSNMYPNEETIKKCLLIAEGKITADEVINELKEKYQRKE